MVQIIRLFGWSRSPFIRSFICHWSKDSQFELCECRGNVSASTMLSAWWGLFDVHDIWWMAWSKRKLDTAQLLTITNYWWMKYVADELFILFLFLFLRFCFQNSVLYSFAWNFGDKIKKYKQTHKKTNIPKTDWPTNEKRNVHLALIYILLFGKLRVAQRMRNISTHIVKLCYMLDNGCKLKQQQPKQRIHFSNNKSLSEREHIRLASHSTGTLVTNNWKIYTERRKTMLRKKTHKCVEYQTTQARVMYGVCNTNRMDNNCKPRCGAVQ